MTDQEKALKEIKERYELAKREYIEQIPEYVDALRVAAEELEKKMPKKVMNEEGSTPFCPMCRSGEYMYNEDENENEYCGQCGQRLDWSE